MESTVYNQLMEMLHGGSKIGIWGATEQTIKEMEEKLEVPHGSVRPYDSECEYIIAYVDSEEKFNQLHSEERPKLVLCPQHMLETMRGRRGVAATANDADKDEIIRALMLSTPIKRVDIDVPDWVRAMPENSSAISELKTLFLKASEGMSCLANCSMLDTALANSEFWQATLSIESDVLSGTVKVTATPKEGIFYQMLSEIARCSIDDEFTLMNYIRMASLAKESFDKVSNALECAKLNGYGVVPPDCSDMTFGEPVTVKQGGNMGIKLKATSPSYHIIKVDVEGEVSPIMGSAAQSESLINTLMSRYEHDPNDLWETNLFGKTLKSMVEDGLSEKSSRLQDDVKVKLKKALCRLVNEGKGGVICILL